MKKETTYIFDNGNVYTVVDGKVVASVKESEWDHVDPMDGENSEHKVVPLTEEHCKHLGLCYPSDPSGHYAVVDGSGTPVSAFNEQTSVGPGNQKMAEAVGDANRDIDLYGQVLSDEDVHMVKDLASQGHSVEEIANLLGMDDTQDIQQILDEEGLGEETPMPDPPKEIQDDLMQQNQPPHMGSRVSTPNGLSGQVLGRVGGMWGDEVTVRFDNGRIVRLPVNQALTFEAAAVEKHESPVAGLNARLAADYDGTKASLIGRVEELKAIKAEAAKLIREGGDYQTEQDLDQIRVQADFELGEVHAALEHLADEDVQAFEAPAPFKTQVVEQAHVGSGDSNWLDHTLGEMISEAENTDYEKLMDEGPEALVAGMDSAAIADAGVTREVAARFIQSKTAAASPKIREKYEGVWLARVEECRKAELLNRKEATKKEAAVKEDEQTDLPDDILFT